MNNNEIISLKYSKNINRQIQHDIIRKKPNNEDLIVEYCDDCDQSLLVAYCEYCDQSLLVAYCDYCGRSLI